MFLMIRRRRMIADAPQIEGPGEISDALDLNRLLYFRNSRRILQWFGFFQSTTHTILYLILTTCLLIGVMAVLLNFDIYDEFKNKPGRYRLVFGGVPYLFLFISHSLCVLTFAMTGNGTDDDKLSNFLLVNDGKSLGVEDNLPHIRQFNSEFSSKISNYRRFIAGVALIVAVFKVCVDLSCLSQQANPFYSVFLIAFWCYLCSAFVLGNGLIYIAVLSCQVHVLVYKDFLNDSFSNICTLFNHHQRLRNFVDRFRQQFSFYLASQILMWIIALVFTLMIMCKTYMNGSAVFMLGSPMGVIAVDIPLFWGILFGLKDLNLQMEGIYKDVNERRNLSQLVSNRPELASDWGRFAQYVQYNRGGVRISYRKVDSSMLRFFGLHILGPMLFGLSLNPRIRELIIRDIFG